MHTVEVTTISLMTSHCFSFLDSLLAHLATRLVHCHQVSQYDVVWSLGRALT